MIATLITSRQQLRRGAYHWRAFRMAAVLLSVTGPASAATPDLTQLSLQELMNIEVTSVSKKPEKRAGAAAAIFVITQDDIRRAGVTSIAEALRLAPGVQVARIDANKWAIGIRGFASPLARSMLVLIDGRSVYDPLFAGTYWDVQDTLLEDIDRIEVIRGPGGTLWGANAVNGVINIITKHAKDTQGASLSTRAGTEERAFAAAHYGAKVGDNTYYRAYGKYFDRDGGYQPTRGDEYDGWEMGRGGFRVDGEPSPVNAITFQGDIYSGHAGNIAPATQLTPPFTRSLQGQTDVSGGNILFRWAHSLGEASEVALKTYYDHTFRRDLTFREERDTFDVELLHRFPLAGQHDINWGIDYRITSDATGGRNAALGFVPANRTDHLVGVFVQDEIALVEDLVHLTVGSKFEHNDYSGFEYQPTARLAVTPSTWLTLWGSISRAVRTPSRIEHDLIADFCLDAPPGSCASTAAMPGPQPFGRLLGNRGFESEKVLAFWPTSSGPVSNQLRASFSISPSSTTVMKIC